MKKEKRGLMFAKLDAEKISSTATKGSKESKSEILMFAKLSAKKGSSGDCQAIEKAREQKKWNLLNFYKSGNRPTSRWG